MIGVLATAVGAVCGVGISWFLYIGSVKLAPILASIHRCSKAHPDWTHEQWVELVEKPAAARWYKRHGLNSKED